MNPEIPPAQSALNELVRDVFSLGSEKGSMVGVGVQVWGAKYRIAENDGSLELHLIGRSMRPEAILNGKALEENPRYLAVLKETPESRTAIEEFQRDFPEVKRAFALKAKNLR